MDINQALSYTVQKEKKLSRVEVSNDPVVSVKFENDKFILKSSDGIGSKQIDLPLMHQIGYRLYGKSLSSKEIIRNFKEQIENNRSHFETEISNALKNSDSIVLLDQSKQIYGIVSSRFEYLNQMVFRDEFVKQYKEYGTPDPTFYRAGFTKYNEPYEKFTFNSKKGEVKVGEEIGYSVFLIYGLNNGYSSFRVFLGREILVCSNGLTEIEKPEFARLKHLSNPDMIGFVKDINETISKYDVLLQSQIQRSKNAALNENNFKELFQRLHVSQVVKDRVLAQFVEERNRYGNFEWAISQALTNIGTHFYGKSHDKHHQHILTEAGSRILDYSLSELLESPVKKELYHSYNTYGILLPKSFNLN